MNLKNRSIYCRDNIDILRGINSACVDLIYLDPPFNKKKVFTAPIGSSAEGASFSDIFTKEDVKIEWLKDIEEDHYNITRILNAVKEIEGPGSYNFCYLAYIAIRLLECHRILKDTGSLFLHCDPTMSHYLKLILDCIFDEKNFRNEIIWHYTGGGRSKSYFSKKHDIIFWYSKSSTFTFNMDAVRVPYEETSAYAKGGITSKAGKVYKPNPKGKVVEDVWYIPIINPLSKERTGYPTQKPLALLQRIIAAASNEGDFILDPFCGCATACVAAESFVNKERQWAGIDVSIKAYELVQERLQKEVAYEGDFFEKEIHFFTDPPKRTDDESSSSPLKKYVYVISNPQYEGEYKVGIASNVKSRLGSYNTGDPNRGYKLEYEHLTPHFRELEAYIHEKYDSRREWVRGDLKSIIKDIKAYKPN